MSDRTPWLSVVKLGNWHDDWKAWHSIGERFVAVWVEDLPLIDEGDEVDLFYFGPVEGDVAHGIDVPVERVLPSPGGFHIVFDAGPQFVHSFLDLDEPEVVEA